MIAFEKVNFIVYDKPEELRMGLQRHKLNVKKLMPYDVLIFPTSTLNTNITVSTKKREDDLDTDLTGALFIYNGVKYVVVRDNRDFMNLNTPICEGYLICEETFLEDF